MDGPRPEKSKKQKAKSKNGCANRAFGASIFAFCFLLFAFPRS
jgi:hypothetical protein